MKYQLTENESHNDNLGVWQRTERSQGPGSCFRIATKREEEYLLWQSKSVNNTRRKESPIRKKFLCKMYSELLCCFYFCLFFYMNDVVCSSL